MPQGVFLRKEPEMDRPDASTFIIVSEDFFIPVNCTKFETGIADDGMNFVICFHNRRSHADPL